MNSYPFILTRYLYRKSQVYVSLHAAILEKDFKQALFWAYELYKSGFQEEVIKFVLDIFDTHYTGFPRLKRYFQQGFAKWKCDKNDHDVVLGTILKNMCMRDFENPADSPEPNYIVILRRDQIEMHDTKPCTTLPCHYLREVCKYPARIQCEDDHVKQDQQIQEIPVGKMEESVENYLKAYRENWLYFAALSPIWGMRLKKMSKNIKINHENQCVEFPTGDLEEEFMDRYNYEPDEQPVSIQQGCLGFILEEN
jgi:hypothetical protein